MPTYSVSQVLSSATEVPIARVETGAAPPIKQVPTDRKGPSLAREPTKTTLSLARRSAAPG